MVVMIGIDPYSGSHMAVAIDMMTRSEAITPAMQSEQSDAET